MCSFDSDVMMFMAGKLAKLIGCFKMMTLGNHTNELSYTCTSWLMQLPSLDCEFMTYLQ